MDELELICGNPKDEEEGASYSRFVIPFAYRLEERGNEKAKLSSYKDITDIKDEMPGLDRRKKYLTCETEKVLFQKARWFKLKASKENGFPKEIEFGLNRKISAVVTAPQLVLFEFSEVGKAEVKKWDILQVGFLILDIHFNKDVANRPTLDDLIKINELFRYFDQPFDNHYKAKGLSVFLDKKFLKTLRLGNEDNKPEDNFYKRWRWLLDDMPIGDKQVIKYADDAGTKNKENPKNTYPDHRAFVWTCAILPDGAKHLWRTFKDNGWKASNYGHWIKLLNVDEPGVTPESTHRSREFEREWTDKHTYHRWEELGTYYGFTPHSGALLGPQFSEPPLWKHFGQMYFDQVLLLLYLRSVLFRFSAKLSEISLTARNNPDHAQEEWAKAFQDLRWQFALFTNLYQFPLLSNQQQGIEMYTLARECMEVDDLFKEVQEEIHSSHDYLSQQQNQVQTQKTTLLTKIAIVVSAVALTIALFSMGWFTESPFLQWLAARLGKFMTFLTFLVIFLLPVSVWLYRHRNKS